MVCFVFADIVLQLIVAFLELRAIEQLLLKIDI